MATVYRLILFTPRPGAGYPEGGSYDTGASYQGCSIDNPGACHPVQFNHLADAAEYARNNGELPVLVSNEADVWAILDGQKPVTDSMIVPESGKMGFLAGLDMTTILIIGAGALFVLPALFRKRGAA
jgi:hypothetical protein